MEKIRRKSRGGEKLRSVSITIFQNQQQIPFSSILRSSCGPPCFPSDIRNQENKPRIPVIASVYMCEVEKRLGFSERRSQPLTSPFITLHKSFHFSQANLSNNNDQTDCCDQLSHEIFMEIKQLIYGNLLRNNDLCS